MHPRRKRIGGTVAVQLFLAPSRIHAGISFLLQMDSLFLPCGMRTSWDAPQSSSQIKLLPSGWNDHRPNLAGSLN